MRFNLKTPTLLKMVLLSTMLCQHDGFAVSLQQHAVPKVFEPIAGAWTGRVVALILHPSFGGNGLGYSSFANYSGNDVNGVFIGNERASNQMSNVFPKWSWGFQLAAAYQLNLSNDIAIEWYHLNNTTDEFLPVGTLFSGNAGGLYAGQIQVQANWNAINLEVGHYLNFNDKKNMRLHGGLAFASISNRFQNYPRSAADGAPVFVSTDDISYSGVGPRMGVDLGYETHYGWGVYVAGAGSVLVGSAKQSISGYQNYTNSLNEQLLYGTANYKQSNNGVVVSELEAKLGLKYAIALSQSKLSFDVGYLWMNYLQAIISYAGVGIVGSSVGTSTTANFDLNGLYFGVQWTGELSHSN